MNLKYKKIEELKPYANNPRINNAGIEYVKNSINEFGFLNPIVIDKNNEIVCGHTRYEASKELGLKEVPCVEVENLTEEEIKEFRLVDNKTQEYGLWDYLMLDKELNNITNINFEDYGFKKIIEEDEIIDFEINEIDEEYKEPEHKMCRCPKCQHEDMRIHFLKKEKER